MTGPDLRFLNWHAVHRLIPSLYSEDGTVLADLAASDADLFNLIALDGVTNDRVQAEQRGLSGISTYELVYGIPNAHIVNAAFTHANDYGSRFNDHSRGAWYAADHLDASVAEVAYHKAKRLADIVSPGEPFSRPSSDVSTFDDWQADFEAQFHFLQPASDFAEFLQPEPVPACYAPSQALARSLLNEGSNGIVYPSVRHGGSTCVACFRPALVYYPRRAERLAISFTAEASGYSHQVTRVEIQQAAAR